MKNVFIALASVAILSFAHRGCSQGAITAPLYLFINGSGIISPLQNNQLLVVGQTYELTAIPDSGFTFNSWQPVYVFNVTTYLVDGNGNSIPNSFVNTSLVPAYYILPVLDFTMQPTSVIDDNPGVNILTRSSGWQANFVPLPEPSAITLFLIGIALIIIFFKSAKKFTAIPRSFIKVLMPTRCGLVLFLAPVYGVFGQANSTAPLPSGNNDGFVVAPSLRQPAVSEINGKVDYSGGEMNSYNANNFSGSITFPISKQFGFQADALYSRISSLDFYGGAGHLFWRNPDTGLLGLSGGYIYRNSFDSINTYQVGAEGELYWHRFTFGFFSGVVSINYQYAAPFIDTNPTRFVGRVSADYYLIDDLRIGGSFETAFHNNLGKGEIEYQTPINGLALTGEAAWGSAGYNQWMFGLRYYFGGGKKTLRDRQRQDDPPGLVHKVLQTLGVYGAEYNKKMDAYFAANPSLGKPSDGGYGVITVESFPPDLVFVPVSSWNPVLTLSPNSKIK